MQRIDRLGIRVRPQDKAIWKAVAAAEGKSLSSWIESKLNEAAKDKNDS
jgi:predicted HicB family RNase H-like nuclease